MSCATEGFSAMIRDLVILCRRFDSASRPARSAPPHPYNPCFSRARPRARTHEFNVPKENERQEKPQESVRDRRRPEPARAHPGKTLRRPRQGRVRPEADPRRHPDHRVHRRDHHVEGGAEAAIRTIRTIRTTPSSSTSTTNESSTAAPAARRSGSTTPAIRTARPTRTRSGRVFIKALRDIEPGEELNYDYGLVLEGRHTRKAKKQFACRCGSRKCRGTMLAPKGR